MAYRIGYLVGTSRPAPSTAGSRRRSSASHPPELEFHEIAIRDLPPVQPPDHDADYPPSARTLKEAIAASDGILFVSPPEYNRSIPPVP